MKIGIFLIRVISVISLCFYILILLYINFGHDKDHEYYSNEYNNCLKNLTEEKTISTDDIEEDCKKYIKNNDYFYSCLFIYAYIVLNIFLKISVLINGKNYSCQTILLAFIMLHIFYFIYFLSICEEKVRRPKTGNTKFYLIIINFGLDLLIIILNWINNKNNNQKNARNYSFDCLDVYFKIKNIPNKVRNRQIKKEISAIEKENDLLEEENQQLIEFKKRQVSNNIEDKKIELILWYAENTYQKIFSANILYKYLLEEIKNKCGEDIDKNKSQKIYLDYIKEKFVGYLNCPLSADIFYEPVITPEGQTFEKEYLLKYLKTKKENPLTRNKLWEEQLIENKLVKNLCEILNQSEFSIDNFIKIKKLLINPENNEFYSNPIVIKEGNKKGETKEGNALSSEYSNKVVLNIIEQDIDILSDEFFEEQNENNINNLDNIEETLNTDTRLNINNEKK